MLAFSLVSSDRRKYRRAQVPFYCRPLGTQFLERNHEPTDMSWGGVRIFSDEELRVGHTLDMELFLPELTSSTCTTSVVWVERLPRGARARFDVGLKFVRLEEAASTLLARILGPPGRLD